MAEEVEEKKEFLRREEIRTMAKDIARLREIEAQKEKERIAALKAETMRKKIVPPIPEAPPKAGPPKRIEGKVVPGPPLKVTRPKAFQKILIRAVFCFLILLIIGFLGWFFGVKKPLIEEIIPPEKEIIPPGEEAVKKPEIIIPPVLIPVRETKTPEVSKTDEIPAIFNQLMAEELPEGTFTRIAIKNIGENRLASLEDLSQAFQIGAPEEIFQKLKEDYTLAIYSQKQGKRTVLSQKLKTWED